ncbi:hypothetical protein AA0114_g12795 [Alternaria tenuissima]|uniref:Uncharacterized protein n=1 Tax=Alternaria tenuissima TaxID=119927 RepID=A0A4Q4LY82_9PLEO|nr:hypothetical protein AA0114_g12795 [Alternaria tenuissima]
MAGISNVTQSIMVLDSEKFYPTRNIWSALTTPFTFGSHCTDNWRVGNVLSQPSDVVPRVTLSIPYACEMPGGQPTHSPGTCLPGFTMVDLTEYRTPTWTTGGARAWGAHCCKENFRSSLGACMSSFTTPLTAYNPERVSGQSISDGDIWFFVTSDSDSRNNSTVISTGVAQMNAMLVYWQESDLEKFDTGYASELAEALLPSNTFAPSVTTTVGTILGLQSETAVPPDRSQLVSATADPKSNSEQADRPPRSGLSTGAKIGIAVGAGIGVVLLFFIGFLLYKRVSILHRKARLDHETVKQNEQPEFVPVKDGDRKDEAYTPLPSSDARWSVFLRKQ